MTKAKEPKKPDPKPTGLDVWAKSPPGPVFAPAWACDICGGIWSLDADVCPIDGKVRP